MATLVLWLALASIGASCSGGSGSEEVRVDLAPSTKASTESQVDEANAGFGDDAPVSPEDITTARAAEAWAMRLAVQHGAPYPGETSAAWVPAAVAEAWLNDHSFRVLQGDAVDGPSGEVLAIAFTAADPRAVFSFERDGDAVSYAEDTLLYLFDPASNAAWIAGLFHDEVESGLAAGRPLE